MNYEEYLEKIADVIVARFPEPKVKTDKEIETELRDWFAGQVLPGLLTEDMISRITKICEENKKNSIDFTAKIAYTYADAMLEARVK